MRAAWIGLLGWAMCAPGREIPVYREYTLPISFYDEEGMPTAAPDREAVQSLRDSKAQEALMGKEAVLTLTLTGGSSVFGTPAPVTGKMTPMTAGGEDNRRRQKGESGRNWLAKSLSLPSLGQTSSNAAASAISAGSSESSWGWLADEVAEGGDRLLEEEIDPLAAQEAMISGGVSPYETARAADRPEGDPVRSSAMPSDRDGREQKSSDSLLARNDSAARDLVGEDRAVAAGKSYRTAPAMAEMSQTRQMISEWSAGARPDLSSWKEALGGASAESGGAMAVPGGSSGLDLSSLAGKTSDRGMLGNRSSGDWGSMAAPAVSSWQGNWNASAAANGEGGLSSRFAAPSDPVPLPVVPASSREGGRPPFSSGGYKPAWY